MKHKLYCWLPSWNKSLHAKRRKGWFRCAQAEYPLQFGQQLQDLMLFDKILRQKKNGVFWELGAGDGVVGLHSLALELFHGWNGVLIEHSPRPLPWKMAQARRRAQCLEIPPANYPTALKSIPANLAQPDLVACHSEEWNEAAVQAALSGALRPRVFILQVPLADPRWLRRLRPAYRFAFSLHDDEYYVARS